MGIILNNQIIRMKFRERNIPVEASFERVWEQMDLLLSETSLKKFIERNIENKFFGLKIEPIVYQREKHGILVGNPVRFLKISESGDAAKKAVVSIKQAKEYFHASKKVGTLTKPVLLYYGIVSFAKALIQATYEINYKNKKGTKKRLNHGLKIWDQDNFKVNVERHGEYQTFHDCYMGDTRIYARKYPLKIDLKDLLAVVPSLKVEWNLSYEKNFDTVYDDLSQNLRVHNKYFKSPTYEPSKIHLKTSEDEFNIIFGLGDEGEVHHPEWEADLGIYGIQNNIAKIIDTKKFVHIIDIYFLTMFILCFYARYRPNEWNEFLLKENNLFLIKAFLRRAELDFPMLMYSELTGIKTYFETFG